MDKVIDFFMLVLVYYFTCVRPFIIFLGILDVQFSVARNHWMNQVSNFELASGFDLR